MSNGLGRSVRAWRVVWLVWGGLALGGLGVGCSSGGSGATTTLTCATDFECPVGQSCDTATSRCVSGLVRDNFVSGTLECIVGALNEEGVELGRTYLSGAIGGRRLEFTLSGGCEVSTLGDEMLLIARGVDQAGVPLLLQVTLPLGVAGTAGPTTFPPYAFYYAAERESLLVADRTDRERTLALAYVQSGSVTVEQAATAAGETLIISLDADVAAPVATPPTCRAACQSQADCGGGVVGREAFDYPECVEQWDGGIKLCDRRCEGATDASTTTCEALGGSCAFLTCTWPTCDSVPDALCVDPVSDADLCYACCSDEVDGRDALYLAQITAFCACDAGAPCAVECSGMCQSGGVEAAVACLQCTSALPAGTACVDAAIDACFADAGCTAYYACLDRRQCP